MESIKNTYDTNKTFFIVLIMFYEHNKVIYFQVVVSTIYSLYNTHAYLGYLRLNQ